MTLTPDVGDQCRRRGGFACTDTVPRLDRSRHGVELDPDLPVVVMWASEHPLQHGCLGAVRTVGRAGVPTYLVVANPDAPVGRSRYVTERILWQPQYYDTEAALIDRLIALSRRLERRPLIVCTGDEMAVLVARHQDVLRDFFVYPDVAAERPGQLADKRLLAELCAQYGFATPRSVAAESVSEIEAALDDFEPPVVVKSTTLRNQSEAQNVNSSIVVHDRTALLELARGWTEPLRILIQEYIPDELSEDWFVNGYRGAEPGVHVVFTGRKDRLWPRQGGSMAAGHTAVNPELAALTMELCSRVGYRGIFDLDWRLDRRTGQYTLLDFNPRVGAQFRMFESEAGVDVVRAMHLDLSGRAIPAGAQIEGERFVVEPWDMASIVSERRRPPAWTGGSGRPRLAYTAADDPAPVFAEFRRQLAQSIRARLR
jgi:predicted ATP-grasp superfamily ATP-dependent carboligase